MLELDTLPQAHWSPRKADHLLSRAAFGGTPEEREALYLLGKNESVETAVDSILVDPDYSAYTYPDWTSSEETLHEKNNGDARREFLTWYMSQLWSGPALPGKLYKFWLDHMPIDWATLGSPPQKRYYPFTYFDILRTETIGDFKKLVRDVSYSGGMIKMLDLDESVANNVNENFGRELLELFTYGVDGGYTEQDVKAAAAAFTGRKTYNGRNDSISGNYPFETYIQENRVDRAEKELLGVTLPAISSGEHGDMAIDIIFDTLNPRTREAPGPLSCAEHTCWKLWRYFVAPEIDPATLSELALRFKVDYAYQIKPLVRDILKSNAFYEDANIGQQVKDPVDFLFSLLKALRLELPPERTLEETLKGIGYEPLYPPNIAGWPEPDGVGNQWLSTTATMYRANIASIFTHKNRDAVNNFTTKTEIDALPDLDLDVIAPKQLRSKENFNLLLKHLNHLLIPFHKIRNTQIRILYNHYTGMLHKSGEEEAIKDMLRLIMALPEFQLQ